MAAAKVVGGFLVHAVNVDGSVSGRGHARIAVANVGEVVGIFGFRK